jgi:hypothetical protein
MRRTAYAGRHTVTKQEVRHMGRGRTIGVTGAAWLMLVSVLVGACAIGGPPPTPSTTPAPATERPSVAPATEPPSEAPATQPPAEVVRMLAACEGVAIRTEPSTGAELVTRVAKLTKVRVAETLDGEAYEAGACGTSGTEWLKIDRINGTSVKKLYGVPFGYAAAGFFQ